MFDKIFGGNKVVSIDPDKLSLEAKELEKGLLARVVGQDRAVMQLVRTMQMFKSGLQNPNRPIGVLLFLGPTGSGKTKLVEALAECLFGHKDRMLKIDCAEYQHDHEIAKLIGSPPGYLGHDKTPARLSQAIIDKHQRQSMKMTIVLFDEIEKAGEGLYELMLGMMDKGKITLGNNQTVDLTKCIIVMTSNEGSSELQKIMSGSTIGFGTADSAGMDQDIWKAAKEALKRKFAPEFLNRINRSIVFHQLDDESLKKIVNIELDSIQDRILMAGHFIILRVTDEAKDFIRKEGTDTTFGARELNRAIERYVVEPVSSLLATKQVRSTDMLTAEYNAGAEKLFFTKMEGVVDPPPPPLPEELD